MKTQLSIVLRQPLGDRAGTHLKAACSFEIDPGELQTGDQSLFLQQLQQGLQACEQALRQARESRNAIAVNGASKLLSPPAAESEEFRLESKGSSAVTGEPKAIRISAGPAAVFPDPAKPAVNSSLPTATVKQLRAIQAIARKMGWEPIEFARQFFAVGRLEQLTLSQASSLIDELKRQQATVA
jgi:hypothetical protein